MSYGECNSFPTIVNSVLSVFSLDNKKADVLTSAFFMHYDNINLIKDKRLTYSAAIVSFCASSLTNVSL